MRACLRVLGATVLLVLAGCSPTGMSGGGVMVTTNILADLTRIVVGDQARVTGLMPPNADPHSFSLSAADAAQLVHADLLIHNGLGLEEGIQRNVDAAAHDGVPTVTVGEQVDPISYRSAEPDGELDPHFWTDPQRVRIAVEVITDRVVADVDGVRQAAIRANEESYLDQLDELDRWMTDRFAEIPAADRQLVTNHHVFGYLAQRYDFEVVGAVIPSGTTLASPSASDLSELANTIRATAVPAIFADSSQPDRLAQVLAEQAGVQVEVRSLFSESLTGPDGGAPTYLDMMRANTNTIVDALVQS